MTVGTSTVVSGLLRLHSVGDRVWVGDDDQPCELARCEPDQLFADTGLAEDVRRSDVVRVLGVRSNAGLVCEISRLISKDGFKHVTLQVVSPVGVPTAWVESDPGAVLHHLWHPPSPAAHGCRAGTTVLYRTFAMALLLDGARKGDPVPGGVSRLAQDHPAWPALTFFKTLDPDAGCRLLCDVLNPKWFRHPARPTRWSRLYAYLGLDPATVDACLKGKQTRGPRADRAANAIRVWHNHRTDSTPSTDVLLSVFGRHKSQTYGVLRATQTMVDIVATAWSSATSLDHPDGTLDLGRCFKSPEDASRFRSHVSAAANKTV